MPLNCPLAYSLTSIPPTELVATLAKKHQLAAVLIKTLLHDMKKRKKAAVPINMLADLLCKHDYDVRYQSDEARFRIAQIYFILLPLVYCAFMCVSRWLTGSLPSAD